MGGCVVVDWTLSFWRLEKDNPVEVFQLDEISSESLSWDPGAFFQQMHTHPSWYVISSLLICYG